MKYYQGVKDDNHMWEKGCSKVAKVAKIIQLWQKREDYSTVKNQPDKDRKYR